MEQIFEAVKTPAGAVTLLSIAVALLSVILQGIKAIIDIIIQVKNRKMAWTQRQIGYVSSLLSMVDGLPIDDGKKIVLKVTILEKNMPLELPNELKNVIKDIMR